MIETCSEPKQMPQWLEEIYPKRGNSPTDGHQREVLPPNVIPEGQRDAALTRMAGAMRRQGMTEEEMGEALLTVNGSRCRPPLPDEQVRKIAWSVGRYPPAPREIDDNSVDSVDSVNGWENPQPFASVEVPSFPIDTLPTGLAEYVAQEAEAKQVPIDLPGCLALGATAAAVAGKAKVVLNDDWMEPLNNNLVSVLPSGERKSPVFREIFKPMEEQERELVATKVPELLAAQTERDILEKRWQNAKNEAAKRGGQANSVAAEAEARDLAEQLAKFVVPPAPRLLADDATPEAVAGLLADQNGRLAIVSTEGGIFDIIAGRYSESVPNLDVYLKGYSGDTIRVDRRSRPAEYIADPCLSVVLTVQPDVIRDLAGKRGFRGRGFLARWLYSLPNSNVGFRNPNAPTVRPEVRAKWKQA